jgi:hypothetical protein
MISKYSNSEIGSKHWYVTCLAKIKRNSYAINMKEDYVTPELIELWSMEIYDISKEMLDYQESVYNNFEFQIRVNRI